MNLEKTILNVVGKILVTPYNWSLVIMTILWWLCCFWFPYYNANFDMASTMEGYIITLSLVCIVVGMFPKEKRYFLTQFGILTQIVAIFALVSVKSVNLGSWGIWILIPCSMFCFLLLLKNIWLLVKD